MGKKIYSPLYLFFCVGYVIALLGFMVYSYVLIDPNITFFNTVWWDKFRSLVVQIGYYHRDWSFGIYALLLAGLFYFHFLALKLNISPVRWSVFVGFILLLSYPFLSHDFFNYLFDAKILTYYHLNPYLYRALDFPQDHWLRFMHWTHRTYPYGPVFLAITLVPSFVAAGKFLVDFLLFKAVWVGFYILAVWLLNKINTKTAIFFATQPLILVEGLVNVHNDLIAVSLALVGAYFVFKKKTKITGTFFFLLSIGIKYMTTPILFVTTENRYLAKAGALLLGILFIYMSVTMEIQPWYFLAIFAFLPFFWKEIQKLELFFAGLLLCYYPYIRIGGWDSGEKIDLKHTIILIAVLLNGAYFFIWREKNVAA
ncbi:hypothetical protein HGA88_00785 [Candidatus Roizmanbacteria bacterium]|nr:hypothetical protein [Candidatus Roizmanbacteria bacterium]